jgi:hypothetical protein
VLDDVERRRLLVEPPGKHPLELAARVADVELDKGPGQLLHLPWSSLLAGAQPHDDVANASRLSRLKLDVAPDPVALVEEAQDGDALRHRSGSGRLRCHGLRNVDRFRLRLRLSPRGLAPLVAAALPAGGQRQKSGENSGRARHHASSGVQAS